MSLEAFLILQEVRRNTDCIPVKFNVFVQYISLLSLTMKSAPINVKLSCCVHNDGTEICDKVPSMQNKTLRRETLLLLQKLLNWRTINVLMIAIILQIFINQKEVGI